MDVKILKFSATWCLKCVNLSKEIEDANMSCQHVIEDIDIDDNEELAAAHNINKVPTIIYVDANTGEKLKRLNGKIDGSIDATLVQSTYERLIAKT